MAVYYKNYHLTHTEMGQIKLISRIAIPFGYPAKTRTLYCASELG